MTLGLQPLSEGDVVMLESSTSDDGEALARLGGMSYPLWCRPVRDDPNRYGWIAYKNGHAVGYLDAEHDGTEAWVAMLVFAPFRVQGLAGRILRTSLGEVPIWSAEVLVGAFESDNGASLRLVTSNGLVESGVDNDGPMIWSRRMDAPQR